MLALDGRACTHAKAVASTHVFTLPLLRRCGDVDSTPRPEPLCVGLGWVEFFTLGSYMSEEFCTPELKSSTQPKPVVLLRGGHYKLAVVSARGTHPGATPQTRPASASMLRSSLRAPSPAPARLVRNRTPPLPVLGNKEQRMYVRQDAAVRAPFSECCGYQLGRWKGRGGTMSTTDDEPQLSQPICTLWLFHWAHL